MIRLTAIHYGLLVVNAYAILLYWHARSQFRNK